MTLIPDVLVITVIVCLIVTAFVAGFWFVIYLIRKRVKNKETRKIRKAILASLKDGPLERGEIVDWLADQDICDESDGDYEISELLDHDFIEVNEEPRYTEGVTVIIDDDMQVLEITTKGKERLLKWGKK